jgi:hypothetical protein
VPIEGATMAKMLKADWVREATERGIEVEDTDTVDILKDKIRQWDVDLQERGSAPRRCTVCGDVNEAFIVKGADIVCVDCVSRYLAGDVDEAGGETIAERHVESEEIGKDLVPVERGLPDRTAWETIKILAEDLASAGNCPVAYRGKPADATLAILTGRELGFSPTQSLRHVVVIEGQAGLSAEGMVALVRQAGHSVSFSASSTEAKVWGKRRDNGDEGEATFTIGDAAQAGLCTIVDGRAQARSRQGRPLPWEQYTEAMLYNRAVSKLCRRLFPDVLIGCSYVPEELEAITATRVDTPATRREVSLATAEQQNLLRGHLSRLTPPETLSDALREEYVEVAEQIKDQWRGIASAGGKAVPPEKLSEADAAAILAALSQYSTLLDGILAVDGLEPFGDEDEGEVVDGVLVDDEYDVADY